MYTWRWHTPFISKHVRGRETFPGCKILLFTIFLYAMQCQYKNEMTRRKSLSLHTYIDFKHNKVSFNTLILSHSNITGLSFVSLIHIYFLVQYVYLKRKYCKLSVRNDDRLSFNCLHVFLITWRIISPFEGYFSFLAFSQPIWLRAIAFPQSVRPSVCPSVRSSVNIWGAVVCPRHFGMMPLS